MHCHSGSLPTSSSTGVELLSSSRRGTQNQLYDADLMAFTRKFDTNAVCNTKKGLQRAQQLALSVYSRIALHSRSEILMSNWVVQQE